jgi:hypothetical protein
MRPQLAERHLPFFVSIDAHPQREAILARIVLRHREAGNHFPDPADGRDLFLHCQSAGLDHARSVLPLVRESDEVGLAAIECLVGQPVHPWAPPAESRGVRTAEGRTRAVPAAPSAVDSLYILAVAPNPKKPGTNAWLQYELWRVGATVADCRQAGLSRAAITWDIERGFVKLGESLSTDGDSSVPTQHD